MISIIVAISKNHVIGNKGKLPWHISEDARFFNKMTSNHPVIMGRKTYEASKETTDSKPKLLKERANIIVSHQKDLKIENGFVTDTIKNAIDIAKNQIGSEEIFVIGGGEIFKEALKEDIIDRMYITFIDKKVIGDSFFPEIDLNVWSLERSSKRVVEINEINLIYYFQTYIKK